MNFFKKIWLSIGASADNFAGKIENQEAIAEGIIGDMEEAVVKVRSELLKTRNELARLEKSLKQQQDEKERWTERARKTAESDREKALQCVRFIKATEQRVVDLQQELLEVRNVEREVLANLSEGEKRLAELRRKKRVLASRQSRAEATQVARNAEGNIFGEAEDLFTRWEAKVGRTEGIKEGTSTEQDLLNMEFSSDEEKVELDGLLDDILNNTKAEAK